MYLMIVTLAAFAQGPSAPVEVPGKALPIGAAQIRQAVEKSLPFLETKGFDWETTKCVSCHHGPWMMWSGYEARKRGFAVNDKALEDVRTRALKAYTAHPKMQPTNRDVLNELSINVVYLTFGSGAAGEPDEVTTKFFDKAVAHLLEQQKENGSWKLYLKKVPKGLMQPLIDSDDVTTMWAILTLSYREASGVSRDDVARSKERGLKFLSENPYSDTLHSLVLRVMLARRLGKTDEMQNHVKQLLAAQNADGGWSQAAKLKSDALGTGQALVALTTAGVNLQEPAIAKAWGYLLKNQKADGSWYVVSRAYEPPEFSSYMGTAWATLGLVQTLPMSNDSAPSRSTQR